MNKLQQKFWESENRKKRRTPDHPAVKAFAMPKVKIIEKVVKPNKNTTLLDVGCGNGYFTKPLSKIFKVKGVDFSEKMISINPVKNCKVQDINNLKEKSNSFDVVFCSNLLHHLKNPNKGISEMIRVSKKYVILSEPNRNNPLMFLFNLIKKEERGALKFNLKYLKKLVKRQGLKIVIARTHGAIVPNKTPNFLIKILRIFDNFPALGFYNIVIAKKIKK